MTSQMQFWQSILQEARNPGQAWVPDELLNRIEADDQPFITIGNWDKTNHFFSGIEEAVGFINLWRAGAPQPSQEECERWIQLLRWLIHGLRNWRSDQDPTCARLTALFVVAQYCDFENSLWETLPSDVGQNLDLLNTVTKLIAGFGCEIDTREGQTALIWEKEAAGRFTDADADEDWLAVDELWNSIEPATVPHALQNQLTRYLGYFDCDRLNEATRNVTRFIVAMQSMVALAPTERLKLGLATTNTRLQFACVYSTCHRQTKTPLYPTERDLLSSLLLKVAASDATWRKWMTVFNRYPLRYPSLQPALGRALAEAPEAALKSYIDSINLFPGQQGSRNNVAMCLAEFRATAARQKQHALWTMAFRRWSDWNFNQADPGQYLFEIAWSELDYPVVAYAIDCLDAGARAQAQKEIFNRLNFLETHWHKSVSDCVTAFNRLLSALQPYAHADATIATGELNANQNLLPLKLSIPHAVKNDRYLRLMYSVR